MFVVSLRSLLPPFSLPCRQEQLAAVLATVSPLSSHFPFLVNAQVNLLPSPLKPLQSLPGTELGTQKGGVGWLPSTVLWLVVVVQLFHCIGSRFLAGGAEKGKQAPILVEWKQPCLESTNGHRC